MENIRKLSDFYDFQYGKGNNNPDNGGQYPVYGSNGIIGWYDKYNSEDAPVIGHIGANCGSVVWASGKHFVTYNGVICKAKQNVNKRFAYYSLLNAHLETRTRGAAQPFVSYDLLNKVSVFAPPFSIQCCIASILSTYDSLIENNTKRIHLLEKMAENLYKEWFVRFRFPGHEKVEFVNGLPKGWKVSRIKDFGRIETGKTPSTKNADYYGGEILFIKTPDMHDGIYVTETEETLSVLGSKSQLKKLLPPNSIMVSCIGTGGVVAINAKVGHTNQQINSIVLDRQTDLEWLFFVCKSLKPTIELFGATGATMTNLSKGKFERLKIIEPMKELRAIFNDKVVSIFKLILKLKEKNTLLARQRDLLLPRLMSGKLEVNS